MKSLLFTILLFLTIINCKVNRTSNPVFESVFDYCNFVDLDTNFKIKVIQYITNESCNCGTRSCASNCIGISNNYDTLRVLFLCQNDSSIKVGDYIEVIPQPKPNSQVTIAQFWVIENNNGYLPELQRHYYRTVYGKKIK